MIRRLREAESQGGQILVLFCLMIVVLVLFVVLTIDVGLFYQERRNGQNVIDSAALAGAQELPDDPVKAEQVARDYAQKNGADPSQLVISFGCTSQVTTLCNAALGKYDTIYIDHVAQAESAFGPVLSVIDAGSCWTVGCTTAVHAAACQGNCGAPNQEVDVVTIIDHTRSMTATDLQNAKDGALTLMRTFDAQKHRVGLVVTPPVTPNNNCDSINTWNDPKVWLPVPLTSQYQLSPGVLDNSSKLVSTTQCLDIPTTSELPGLQTNLGDPLKAALQELQSRGRPDVGWGIVLETDGAANVMDAKAAQAIGARGPCDYAFKISQQVKNAGIELYTIGYGADDRCTADQTNSPWYNRTAVQLLTAMASDSDHVFIEPKSADLDPVFKLIGVQLGSGSKLIE
jgi:Flp pilus assembly protein TadG